MLTWSDHLLQRRVLESGLLSASEVDSAVREQEDLFRRTGAAPSLGAVLVRQGKLGEEDLERYVDDEVRSAFDSEEESFVSEATAGGVDEEALRAAFDEARQSKVPRRTAEVLAAKGAVPRAKLERLGRGVALPPGATFGKYRIVERLGRGGMGEVYKALQPDLNREVAIKVLPSELEDDPAIAQRFQREAHALARLNHPNIVTVFESGVERGRCYFVMEYVDGPTLRQLLKEKRLDAAVALQLIPQICDALEYAHDEGIVHRDVKPENILIDRRGRVRVADFGLARVVDPEAQTEITRTKGVLGTVCYMAPEQVENPKTVDHRADIYSLGVVLYEMLTGELPLGHFEPPSRKAGFSARMDDVVLKALEKAPERRFQRASEVKEAVGSAGGGRGAGVGGARRRAWRWAVGGLAALALLAGLGYGLTTYFRGGGANGAAGTGDAASGRDGSGGGGPGAGGSGGAGGAGTGANGGAAEGGLLEALVLAEADWPRGAEPRPNPRRLPRNPLLATATDDRRAVVEHLTRHGRLPAVEANDVRRAYFAGMGGELAPAYAVLEMADEAAARAVQRGVKFGWGAPVWAERRGRVLVYAYHEEEPRAAVPVQRYRFEHLVNLLRRRLGHGEYAFGGLRPFYLPEGFAPPGLEGNGFPAVHLGAEGLEVILRDEWRLRLDSRDVACVYRWRFDGRTDVGDVVLEYVVARSDEASSRTALLAHWRRAGADPVASGTDAEVVGAVIARGAGPALERARPAIAELERILREKLR